MQLLVHCMRLCHWFQITRVSIAFDSGCWLSADDFMTYETLWLAVDYQLSVANHRVSMIFRALRVAADCQLAVNSQSQSLNDFETLWLVNQLLFLGWQACAHQMGSKSNMQWLQASKNVWTGQHFTSWISPSWRQAMPIFVQHSKFEWSSNWWNFASIILNSVMLVLDGYGQNIEFLASR